VSWFIAERLGSRKTLKARKINASVRAEVEHPFRYINLAFGYSRYCNPGLAKNSNRQHLLAAVSNLVIGE
jgi:IS5 family transposase